MKESMEAEKQIGPVKVKKMDKFAVYAVRLGNQEQVIFGRNLLGYDLGNAIVKAVQNDSQGLLDKGCPCKISMRHVIGIMTFRWGSPDYTKPEDYHITVGECWESKAAGIMHHRINSTSTVEARGRYAVTIRTWER